MKSSLDFIENLTKRPNHSFQVLEFMGTPGCGKTHLSEITYKWFQNKPTIVNRLSIYIGKMSFLKRVISKTFFVLFLIVMNSGSALNVIKVIRQFHFKIDRIFIKLSFNLMYVIGVIRFCKNKNQILIMDQGISQSIWSCIFHGNNANFNSENASSILITIFSKIRLDNLLAVHVRAELEKIKFRLGTRLMKGTSPLNSGKPELIRKGVQTTLKTRDVLDKVSRHAALLTIVDVRND